MAYSSPVIKMTGVDTLANSIRVYDNRVKRVIAGQFLYHKDEGVNFAKLNAPWTDRTAAARTGLHGAVNIENQGESFELIFAHSVPYGIWLEVRFSGKYAILMPTTNYIGALMLSRIASSIKKMEEM